MLLLNAEEKGNFANDRGRINIRTNDKLDSFTIQNLCIARRNKAQLQHHVQLADEVIIGHQEYRAQLRSLPKPLLLQTKQISQTQQIGRQCQKLRL